MPCTNNSIKIVSLLRAAISSSCPYLDMCTVIVSSFPNIPVTCILIMQMSFSLAICHRFGNGSRVAQLIQRIWVLHNDCMLQSLKLLHCNDLATGDIGKEVPFRSTPMLNHKRVFEFLRSSHA